MAYKVCHVEWEVTDLEQAKAFYGTLFEWEFKPFGDSMLAFGTGTEHIGGLMKATDSVRGNSPSVWLDCPDIDSLLKKVGPAGGTVASEKSPLPSVGFTALIRDPDGNHIGLVEFDCT